MRKARLGLFVAVPVVLVGAALLWPQADDLESFAREGEPVPPGSLLAFPNEATGLNVPGIAKRSGCRVRAWSLRSPASSSRERLRQLGFTQSLPGDITPYRMDGTVILYGRMNGYSNPQTDARMILLYSVYLPKDVDVVLLVEEPVGPKAAWRRFLAPWRR